MRVRERRQKVKRKEKTENINPKIGPHARKAKIDMRKFTRFRLIQFTSPSPTKGKQDAPMIDKVELAFAQQLKALLALCAAARGLGVERGASLGGRRELGALLGDARRRLLGGWEERGGNERETRVGEGKKWGQVKCSRKNTDSTTKRRRRRNNINMKQELINYDVMKFATHYRRTHKCALSLSHTPARGSRRAQRRAPH